MNFFRLKSGWHYRHKSLSRHGIHSPFVYRFVEEALRAPLPATALQAFLETEHKSYSPCSMELLARCALFLKKENSSKETAYRILDAGPEALRESALEHLPHLREGLCLLIPGIHETQARASLWNELATDSRVNLSLEIWQLGLLFFRTDFQEKQHFVLRRRG